MEHSQALATLLSFAEQPARPPPGLDAVIAHVAACPACATGIAHLAEALRFATEDRLTCVECDELLPEYLAAAALPQDAAPRWAELRVHLVACPACREALADLAELQALAERASGAEPAAYPAARTDKAVPPARPAPAPARPRPPPVQSPWSLDSLGRLIVDLAQALLPASPSPSPPLAGLKSAPCQTTLAEVTIGDALPDLALRITVEGRLDADRRHLLVSVEIPSRGGWPNLGGSEIVLLKGEQMVARATTDAFGSAAFTNLAAGEIEQHTLMVRPGVTPGGPAA